MSKEHGLYIPPDPNITNYSTGHYVQRLTVNERFIMVEDPQLGDYVIGSERKDNGLYYDYLTTPNAYRSMGISQLCKDRSSATIPNTSYFNRNWHMVGLFGLVDTISDTLRVEDETRLAYHLATDADDQAHMDFSHANEANIQAWGGPEDYHEEMWPRIAWLGGTTEVMRKHEVKVNSKMQIPGIEIPAFINVDHPDINLDRFQYGVTELLAWFDHDGAQPEMREQIRSICSPDNLTVTGEGKLAFKDVQAARIFSKGYLLLSTEHWNDPVNRVQLHLLIQATQRAIVKRRMPWMDEIDKGELRRPISYLYGIDEDIVEAMKIRKGNNDNFMHLISNALYPIAMEERSTFTQFRLGEYTQFMLDDRARDYPSEYLPPKRVEFGSHVSQVEVKMHQVKDDGQTGSKIPTIDRRARGIKYRLSPLKNRYIDPLVQVSGDTFCRLSEIDENYASLLRQQQKLQKMSVDVKMAFTSGFEKDFKEGVDDNDREFRTIIDRSLMTDDQERRVIEQAAERAKAIAVKTGTLILKSSA